LQKELENIIENKKNLKLNLLDGNYINLKWDDEKEAYKGIVEEINLNLGYWDIETIFDICNDPVGWKMKLEEE